MTQDQVVTSLNKIIDVTRSMLGSARSGEWEQVQELEQHRQQLFSQTFPLDQDTITDAAAIAAHIQQIVDINEETMQLAANGRKELAGLLGDLASGRQAVTAYQRNKDI